MKKLIAIMTLLATGLSLQAQLEPALDGATDNGDGTYTNWFGTFAPETGELANTGWVEHTEHGRLYVIAHGNGLWIYDPNVAAIGAGIGGWIYTSNLFFPYFYINAPVPYLIYVAGIEGPEATPRVFLVPGSFDQVLLPDVTTATVVDIAVASDDFNTLVAAVTAADLAGTLSGEGPFTVFAPTDAAFAEIPTDTLNDLVTNANDGRLANILTYHVVAGKVLSGAIGLDLGAILRGEVISGFVETLNGSVIRIDTTPFGVMINGTSMVTVPDIEASNGVIHVIDEVLMPPADIVDTAVAAGFSSLAAAVTQAGLVDTLKGDGPFTVFAPTDEAFAAAAASLNLTLQEVLELDNLGDILTYHVVAGDVYASEVMPGEVTMVNGDTATLSVNENGGLMINGANIIATDVVTSNGVIHVIDAVILPPAE